MKPFWTETERVIAALIEVHQTLGPGLLEAIYEECFVHELALRGMAFERQRAVPLSYKGLVSDLVYRLDVIVEGQILVEIKSVEHLLPVHSAQVFTYLRLTGLPVGLLANFNVPLLVQGLRRLWPRSRPSEE